MSVYRKLCDERGVKANPLVDKVLSNAGDTLDLSPLYVGSKQILLVLEVVQSSMRGLAKLSFAGNNISPDVITALCSSLSGLNHLRTIDLSKNQLGIHSGRELLEFIKANASVQELVLTDTLLPDYLVEDINTQLESNKYQLEAEAAAVVVVKKDTSVPLSDNYDWEWLSNAGDNEQFVRDQQNIDAVIAEARQMAPLESSSVAPRPRQLADDMLNPIPSFMKPHELSLTMGTIEAEKFTDDEFPPEPTSLFSLLSHHEAKSLTKSIEWVRASEMPGCTEPTIIPPQGPPSYIHQGTMFATRWFRGAMLLVMQDRDALRATCVKAFGDIGMYTFKFYKSGTPVEVTVDDYIPTFAGSRTPCTSHHDNPNEIWASLVEKAYAKLHGGYDKIVRGSLSVAISDLTNATILKTSWSLPSVKNSLTALKERIREALIRKHRLVAQSVSVGELSVKAHLASGIEPNTPYEVNDVREIANYTLVRLAQTNPTLAWAGRFSRGSAELQEFSAELPLNPDGSLEWFWIPLEDFTAFFDTLREIRNPAHEPASLAAHSVEFKSIVGPPKGRFGTIGWLINPAYSVQAVERHTEVVFSLFQTDQRLHRSQPLEYSDGLQLHVMRAPAGNSGDRHYAFNEEDVIFKTPEVKHREISCVVKLQPDTPVHVYVTHTGKSTAPYLLRVGSTAHVRVKELHNSFVSSTVKGEWFGSTAAGRVHSGNNYTGFRNPQFKVKVSGEPQTITFALAQEGTAQPLSIAMGLWKCDMYLREDRLSYAEVIREAQYSSTNSITFTCTLDPGNYVLVPATWAVGEAATFHIATFSSKPIEMKRFSV